MRADFQDYIRIVLQQLSTRAQFRMIFLDTGAVDIIVDVHPESELVTILLRAPVEAKVSGAGAGSRLASDPSLPAALSFPLTRGV